MLSEAGNTSTAVYGSIANEGRILSSYTIVNKSLTNVNANLAVRRSGLNVNIIPKDTQIFPGAMYPYGTLPIPVGMNSGDNVVLIVTGGSVDYSFSYSKPNS